ncbi:hypothetical protein [Gynurincola endophyticus]|uniref:hypothetical protein n=1 Tax=Gynurincola endophyticus TaxID=2479004 RepID=UPI000F8E635C|nr:hypothetical protein [Gynurincola endophyticus]
MSQSDNLNSFFTRNKVILKDYVNTNLELFRLRAIRVAAKSVGTLVFVMIAMFFGFLILLFAGLVLGFWLSSITGSYVSGFGYATLILMGLLIIIYLMRNILFINPALNLVLDKMQEDPDGDDDDDDDLNFD